MNPTIKLGEEYGFNITPSNPNDKKPVIKNWQNTWLKKEDLLKYEKIGYNLGYVCGPTKNDYWLIVIDFDNKKAFDGLKRKIPKTLVVNTGKKGDWRGKQVYFICKDRVENNQISDDTKEIISIRGEGRFVVGPGSMHPTGVKYEIALDTEIAEVGKEFFDVVYDDVNAMFGLNGGEQTQKKEIEFKHVSPLYTLTYQDVFPGIEEDINIEHPLHGSDTGHNFKIEDGLGRCFRHNVTLGAWQMLAVKAGLLKCEEAGNGFKGKSKSKLIDNPDLIKELWDYAIKENFISMESKLPSQIMQTKAPAREDIFVHKYDNDGNITNTKILTGVLGSFINHRFIFKTLTDTEEVFVYSNGVYVPGETLIKSECQIVLGEKLVKTHYVNEATDFIRRATYEDRESFDLDDKLINLKNGLYDVENNQIIKHTSDYLSFIQIPIEYNSSAKCELWDKYLGNTLALEEDRMILQEVAGWVLMGGYNIQKAVLLEGGGGNGKSVFLDTITAMIGADNVSNVSWQELGEDRFAKAQLYGKMANIHTDLSKNAVSDTSAFKALTGGDKIWSDVKHSIKGINFYNRAKLIYAANQIPRTKDITDAFFDRLILINFPYKIRGTDGEDKKLKNKLLKELPGIFNWSLIGLNRLIENEQFSTSKTTDDFKSMFMKKSDSVFAFFGDLVRKGNNQDKETKEDVYQKYVAYCRRFLNIQPVNKQVFGAAFGKQSGYIGSGQRFIDIEGGEKPIRVNCWTNILIKKLPGKQDTIPWDVEGIVSGKSEPENGEDTIDTIPKTLCGTNFKGVSPDNTNINEKTINKTPISDKNREKGIVSIDYSVQKNRLFFLISQIKTREKAFPETPVRYSELADEYQLLNLTSMQLEQDIITLKNDGQIYEPKDKRYKSV